MLLLDRVPYVPQVPTIDDIWHWTIGMAFWPLKRESREQHHSRPSRFIANDRNFNGWQPLRELRTSWDDENCHHVVQWRPLVLVDLVDGGYMGLPIPRIVIAGG